MKTIKQKHLDFINDLLGLPCKFHGSDYVIVSAQQQVLRGAFTVTLTLSKVSDNSFMVATWNEVEML